MAIDQFHRETALPVDADEAFAWHARPGAFQRLAPPWQSLKVTNQEGTIRDGDSLTMRMGAGPFSFKWVAKHYDFIDGKQFCDRQVSGPFRFWEHRHRFNPVDDNTSELIDQIEYRLPFGSLGNIIAGRCVHRQLERVFSYRHYRTRQDLALLSRYRAASPMTVAVSGSSGLVGSALVALLLTAGHRVIRLVRFEPAGEDQVQWDPMRGLDPSSLSGVDAVVHLAGDNLAAGRWTRRKMQRIRESRVVATRKLAESLAATDQPPKILVSASAIGYYGDRGAEPLSEQSGPGSGFLADVVRNWEDSTAPAADAGVRVCLARFGVILSPMGGALKKMLPAFKLGVGGRIGNGRQILSWVDLHDAIGAVLHMLVTPGVSGPVNITSPNPVNNAEFSRTLGHVLRRPAFFPMPATAARIALGRMADELLLAGAHVTPAKLVDTNYVFGERHFESALRRMLGCIRSEGPQ